MIVQDTQKFLRIALQTCEIIAFILLGTTACSRLSRVSGPGIQLARIIGAEDAEIVSVDDDGETEVLPGCHLIKVEYTKESRVAVDNSDCGTSVWPPGIGVIAYNRCVAAKETESSREEWGVTTVRHQSAKGAVTYTAEALFHAKLEPGYTYEAAAEFNGDAFIPRLVVQDGTGKRVGVFDPVPDPSSKCSMVQRSGQRPERDEKTLMAAEARARSRLQSQQRDLVADTRAALERVQGPAAACLAETGGSSPVSLAATLTIAPDGRVTNVELTPPLDTAPTVLDCLRNVFLTIEVRPFQGEAVTLKRTLSIVPASKAPAPTSDNYRRLRERRSLAGGIGAEAEVPTEKQP